MSNENLVENYINTNIKNNYSEFYDIHDENDNNNNIETTITENNNTETDSNININIDSGNSLKIQKNFIEKKNVCFIPPLIAKNPKEFDKIEALKLGNVSDHYYLESLLNEFWNKENQKNFVKKSRNYLLKSKACGPSKEMIPQLKLYYSIRVNNNSFCTYYDQYYRQHKKVFEVPFYN